MRHFCTIEDDLEPSKNVYLLFEKKPVENNIWSSKLHKADIEARYDSVIRKISQVRITNKACVKKNIENNLWSRKPHIAYIESK